MFIAESGQRWWRSVVSGQSKLDLAPVEMAKGVNEVDSWAVASYVDCRLPLGTLSPENAACPNIPVRTRRERVCTVAGRSRRRTVGRTGLVGEHCVRRR